MYLRIGVTLVLTVVLRMPVQAQGTAEGDCTTLVSQAFDVAGLNDILVSLPEQLQSGVDAHFARDPAASPAVKRQVSAALKAAFRPARTGALMKQELLRNCDVETVQPVVEGLNTPLGMKMRQLEAHSATPQGRRQLEEYAASLPQHPPDRARLALIQKMDASVGGSAFSIDVAAASVRGMGAAAGGLPQGFEESFRKQIAGPAYNALLVCLLFTYRDVSDADLVRYTELYETPAFVRFSEQYQKAFLAVIERQSQEAITTVIKSVPGPRTLRE